MVAAIKAKGEMPTPIRVNDNFYRVPSFTLTLHAYELRRNEYGAWECSCQAYARRHTCKHEGLLVQHLSGTKQSVAPKGLTLEALFADIV